MEQQRPRAEVRKSFWTEKETKPQRRLLENSNSYIFLVQENFLSTVVSSGQGNTNNDILLPKLNYGLSNNHVKACHSSSSAESQNNAEPPHGTSTLSRKRERPMERCC